MCMLECDTGILSPRKQWNKLRKTRLQDSLFCLYILNFPSPQPVQVSVSSKICSGKILTSQECRSSIIKSWYQREGYIQSMADLIQKELQTFTNPSDVMIFFSAHGVPVSYVTDAGDPYKDQMEECIYLIMQELKNRGVANDHTLAYQSRVGPVQWLQPYTDKVLVELGEKGVKNLLAVPVSFVSEHIETLEEIDMEYRELALESGIENWGRVPALNCTPSFISDLA
ncbi:unnamed protein product [Rhodiola kirilowii]